MLPLKPAIEPNSNIVKVNSLQLLLKYPTDMDALQKIFGFANLFLLVARVENSSKLELVCIVPVTSSNSYLYTYTI